MGHPTPIRYSLLTLAVHLFYFFRSALFYMLDIVRRSIQHPTTEDNESYETKDTEARF